MPHLLAPARNKHQARTQDTQAKILDAAEAVFAEQGFEKTQLEQVATRAGFTRGAIYAHYSSKEDLFLALVEQRVYLKFMTVHERMTQEPDVSRRPAIFKQWVIAKGCEPSWSTLMLEFKLYALRRPSSRAKLERLHELLFKSVSKDFVELLFGGGMTKAAHAAAERRIAIMGAVISTVILESHFHPELLPTNQLGKVIEELFDALVHP